MMSKLRVLLLVTLLLIVFFAGFVWMFSEGASAHYVSGCQHKTCKVHVIQPYVGSFLEPVGACESGTGSYDLAVGLHAISPGGTYRGRYQFGWPDWGQAGGHGDPARATWYEQAYRAVVWLHRNGRDSWPNC